MTKREILALKAVVYGCSTNKKYNNETYFVVHEKNGKKISVKEEMLFIEAIDIVTDIVNKLEKKQKEETKNENSD